MQLFSELYFSIMIFFGENLQLLRKGKGLNQAELSDIIGVGRNTLSDYENGRSEPNFSTLVKISDFFGVNVHTLLVEALNNVHLIKETEAGKKTEKNLSSDSGNQRHSVLVEGESNMAGPVHRDEDLIGALRMVIETQKNLIDSLNAHNSILQDRLNEVEKKGSK